MDDSSQQKLIQNGSRLVTAQTVSELNHDVNSNGACDEKVLENHACMENHKSIKGGSPIPDGLEATQGNETNEVSTPVKRSRGRPRKTERKIIGSPRVLRSRSQEKPKAPESVEAPLQEVESKEKKRRKKMKKIKKDHNNEFSKIIRHLRYLIHRMAYEQNFIEAYAGEGWKGQSLEKLRPEKELERAKSDINRYKLKIRDLFQRVDKSCEEGRIPESLYDSEGLIDSEDIFCAKCGQTEVRLDNDIILCDGACERGFHQFCLDPPLLKEQVPPGDEGWLCPACDCKVDCFDMLNDSQGTNLSVTDSWEKVFPETATFGNRLDDNSGLPSDDSGDDDYDPDGPEVEEDADAEDSSSDESDSSFASEDLGAVANNDPLLGLPSEDSEDDDFNPDKVDSDKEAKSKSSSSDFTSDFDDLGDINKNEVTSDEVQEPVVPAAEEEIPKTNMEDDDCGPITAKRRVERLDYKKLHDETYGNVSSDSSDEDFSDSEAPRRRKKANGAKGMEVNEKMEKNESTPVSRTSKKLDAEGTSGSPAIKGSSDKSGTRSSYKRLGQAVTQRLYESFQENQYPDRDVRENLAKEVNLTQNQVRKWFENARWSFNHHGTHSKAGKSPAEPTESVIPKQVNVSSSNTPKSRKRKTNADQHDTETTPSLKEASPMDSSNQTTRRSGRVQAKKLTSVP